MRFRCRRCGETAAESRRLSRHVVDEHGRTSLGWDIERVPERGVECLIAWLSNLPIRIRGRLGRLRSGGSHGGREPSDG